MSSRPLSIAVLISGNGSNLQAIIDACTEGGLRAVISCVVSNVAGVHGLQRAERASIPTHVLPHGRFADRALFDRALASLLHPYQVDLIVLAGFMRILGAEFIARYPLRVINLHPSLLPKYKGLNTHARALAADDKVHGATVHFVTADLDDGPIIVQSSIDVEPEDTAVSLQQKVHRLEHEILPRAIGWIAQGRIAVANGKVMLDGSNVMLRDSP